MNWGGSGSRRVSFRAATRLGMPPRRRRFVERGSVGQVAVVTLVAVAFRIRRAVAAG